VLEEYGEPNKYNHSIIATWQETLLSVEIAADQIWQFGPANLSINQVDVGDEFSVFYDREEFQRLAKKQAQAMLDKKA
jgi:mannan endo-1,4-beta-mannosidase